jgi:hypothetical protein
MYKDNEILETTLPIGKKDTSNYLPKGSKVKFIKVVNNDLENSLLVVEIAGRKLAIKETDVRIRSWWRRRKAINEFNKQMYVQNPRLRRYHKNLFKRVFYKVYYYLKDLKGESDV